MCKNNVCILPVVVSIILGIVIGALFFAGTIAVGIIIIPLIIGIILAVINLILLYVTAAFGSKRETKECVCNYGGCLTLGAFVTLVSAFLALTFESSLVAGGIVSAGAPSTGGHPCASDDCCDRSTPARSTASGWASSTISAWHCRCACAAGSARRLSAGRSCSTNSSR